jgi:hypothetical protein
VRPPPPPAETPDAVDEQDPGPHSSSASCACSRAPRRASWAKRSNEHRAAVDRDDGATAVAVTHEVEEGLRDVADLVYATHRHASESECNRPVRLRPAPATPMLRRRCSGRSIRRGAGAWRRALPLCRRPRDPCRAPGGRRRCRLSRRHRGDSGGPRIHGRATRGRRRGAAPGVGRTGGVHPQRTRRRRQCPSADHRTRAALVALSPSSDSPPERRLAALPADHPLSSERACPPRIPSGRRGATAPTQSGRKRRSDLSFRSA